MVEGDKTEPELIEKIYKCLGFNTVRYDKRNGEFKELINTNDKYSKVYIVPALYSSLSNLTESDDYFDKIYHKLAIEYELDVENAAIYYIFVRDRDSNRPNVVMKLFEKFYNSRDNGFGMNGLILLSYPSIEAFYSNIHGDNCKLKNGKVAKEYTKDYYKLDINDEKLVLGTRIIVDKILSLLASDFFNLKWLDSFKNINEEIFEYEENEYTKYENYYTLSLIFISFIDLGIIDIL